MAPTIGPVENDWTGACCSSRTGAGVASIFVGAAAGGGVTFGASGRLVSGAYMCGWVAGRACGFVVIRPGDVSRVPKV